jgi:hypothetical protein
MVLPEENDPEGGVERQPSKPGRILPFERRHTPDWLIRPGDEARLAPDPGDEPEGGAAAESAPRPGPPLLRPAAWGVPGPESEREKGPAVEEEGPAPAVDADAVGPTQPLVAWKPAASSIPVLREPPSAEPETLEPRPATVALVRPPGLPGAAEDQRQAAAPMPSLQPLGEPWWVVALDTLSADARARTLSAAMLVCVVALGAWLWPRGAGNTPLAQVRRNPSQYDGRTVVVRGRVGSDVYPVGGGWAFYLLQDRDTIVAFTRFRSPRPRQRLTVRGFVSTGFLDGIARPALFEGTPGTQ